MIRFSDFVENRFAVKQVKRIKRYPPKEPTPPKESDWPPYVKPPVSFSNSVGINELQTPIQSSIPNKPTPPMPSYPEDPKEKKKRMKSRTSVLGSGIEAGLHTPAS